MTEFGQLATIFITFWLITFIPAWIVLLKLLAYSASTDRQTLKFVTWLIIYRLLIAAPYVALLVLGVDVLPKIVQLIVVGILIFGLSFSVIRFIFKDRLIVALWGLYGYVYDGLLHFAPYRRLVAQLSVLAQQTHPQAQNILELGCGSGNVLLALSEKFPDARLAGVDSSASMLKPTQKKVPTADIFLESATDFLQGARDGSFDLIVMQNVLYAINDRKLLWQELHRVMADNGSIIVTNSDRAGSSSITTEHLRYGSFWELFHPKLIVVGVIDAYISQLSKTGSFHFLDQQLIAEEVADWFEMSQISRCYGNVNIMFSLNKKSINE